MANPSVIVYGPPGCGKTSNRERLKRHFGLGQVLEGASLSGSFRVQQHHRVDHLILCNDPGQLPGALLGLPCHEFTSVVFDEANPPDEPLVVPTDTRRFFYLPQEPAVSEAHPWQRWFRTAERGNQHVWRAVHRHARKDVAELQLRYLRGGVSASFDFELTAQELTELAALLLNARNDLLEHPSAQLAAVLPEPGP